MIITIAKSTLAGIELVAMLKKGKMNKVPSGIMSPAEYFYSRASRSDIGFEIIIERMEVCDRTAFIEKQASNTIASCQQIKD
jgi:hypothetical protein